MILFDQIIGLWVNDMNQFDQMMHGWWRVLYPDGKLSQRFYWATARNYRAIFGGKVVWHTYGH